MTLSWYILAGRKKGIFSKLLQIRSMCVNDYAYLDIWLAVHHSITFLLLPTWCTNFLFIYTNYIKLNSSTCFERIPPIIRRSTTQIVHMLICPSFILSYDSFVFSSVVFSSPSSFFSFCISFFLLILVFNFSFTLPFLSLFPGQ